MYRNSRNMMLRSSSTPVLGSLIASSFSESPNHHNHHHHQQHYSEFHGKQTPPTSIHSKLSCTGSNGGGGSQNLGISLFHYSPNSVEEVKGTNSRSSFIRRVQSEGNLEDLAGDKGSSPYDVVEGFSLRKKIQNKKRNSCCTLEAIPSFSMHDLGNYSDELEDEESEYEEDEHEYLKEIDGSTSNIENFVSEKVRRDLMKDHDYSRFGVGETGKMYIASGLGISGIDFIDGGGGGSDGGFRLVAFETDGGGDHNRGLEIEEHYQKMLQENPGNPLVLRNYAQFLYQRKGDVEGAEEYYSRAILADPQDGEVLSQYAKMIWEIHRDKERARNYFERAVRASSEDSHIHAAYASFLWDLDDEDEEDEEESSARNLTTDKPLLHRAFMASATAQYR